MSGLVSDLVSDWCPTLCPILCPTWCHTSFLPRTDCNAHVDWGTEMSCGDGEVMWTVMWTGERSCGLGNGHVDWGMVMWTGECERSCGLGTVEVM